KRHAVVSPQLSMRDRARDAGRTTNPENPLVGLPILPSEDIQWQVVSVLSSSDYLTASSVNRTQTPAPPSRRDGVQGERLYPPQRVQPQKMESSAPEELSSSNLVRIL